MTQHPRNAPGVRLVEIDANQAGQRIDNFLARELKGVPKSMIYRILRQGQVRVNRGRIRPDYRLKSGDTVRVPPVRTAAEAEPVAPPPALLGRLRAAILYEDDDLLVLDKPAGLAVHGGSGLRFGVIELLRALRPQAPFLELVHRLDRDTSGCLLIAKTREALTGLHTLLRDGEVDKRYLALAAGHWDLGTKTVTAALRKNVERGGERMVEVDEETGRPATTTFRLVKNLRGACLLEVQLDTGRTHQIRVHAAHLGHPLAGDEKYGDARFNRSLRAAGLKRLFLHAHSISFQLPGAGREIHVSTPLGADLRAVLNELESGHGG